MVIIGATSHSVLAHTLAIKLGCEFIRSNTQRFFDQELKIQINKNLYNQDVVIVQSTSQPANDHLMELLLLADTAKRAGCRHLTAVIPYFGYGRQDRPSYDYGPISASLVASLLETSGVDRVVCVDLHSKQSEGFFKKGIKNLDPVDLFANEFKETKDLLVVSPDVGGILRAKKLAQKLSVDFAIINKNRSSSGACIMSEVVGAVAGKNCIILDDIVDTGNTLVEAAKVLKQNQALSVSACITHAVFSPGCVEKIEHAHFSKILITDTIHHQTYPSFINLIPVSDLIAKSL